MYSNSKEIKNFINQVVTNKLPYSVNPNLKIQETDFFNETFVYFKGKQLLCIEGIIFWLFFLFGLFFIGRSLTVFNIAGLIASSIFCTIWVLIWIRRLYYFGVSDNYFIVKIANVVGFKKVYRLSDIREVVFELPYKMPVSLRIITNDFESKLYPAATLWSKKWIELKDELEKKNIKVRNEGVYYEPFEFKLFN
jgi:hypothetical protein